MLTVLLDEDEAEGEDDSDYERTDDSESDEALDDESEEEDVDDLVDVPQDAEDEIEGDFECVTRLVPSSGNYCANAKLIDSRLIANIRGTDGTAGSEMMTKQWDFSTEDKDAEFRDDLRAASGIGRKRKKVLSTRTCFLTKNCLCITGWATSRPRAITASEGSRRRRQPGVRRWRYTHNSSHYAGSHPYRTARCFCMGSSRSVLRGSQGSFEGAAVENYGGAFEARRGGMGEAGEELEVSVFVSSVVDLF